MLLVLVLAAVVTVKGKEAGKLQLSHLWSN